MFVFWNHDRKVKRKRGGIKVKKLCSECGQEAYFYECESVDQVKIYGLVKIFDYSKIVVQCGECLAVFKAKDDPDISKAFEEREKSQEAEAEKELARQKAKEEEAKRKEEEKRRKEYEKQKAKQESEIDDELDELKKQMNQ